VAKKILCCHLQMGAYEEGCIVCWQSFKLKV
jgi:hypothetical protein